MTRPWAVVTGAGSGIGAAIALRLADSHDLLLGHLQPGDDLDQVRTACRAQGASTATVTGDLTDPAVAADLDAAITARTGHLHVVVSAAGAGYIAAKAGLEGSPGRWPANSARPG